jgi:hypothetical protein
MAEYLEKWNQAGRPERESPPKKKGGTPKKSPKKRTYSSDDDNQNDDPAIVAPVTPTLKRKASMESIKMDGEIDDESEMDKSKAPAQELVLQDLTEISERIGNLIQVKNMGLLTGELQKQLKKLLEQKQQRTNELKRLQAKQRAQTRYRERKKRCVEQLCVSHPDVAAELSKIFKPITMRAQIESDCPDLLQIIAEVACLGGATDNNNNNKDKSSLTLSNLKDVIKRRGYEIHKSSQYYR